MFVIHGGSTKAWQLALKSCHRNISQECRSIGVTRDKMSRDRKDRKEIPLRKSATARLMI
jgi:hypothetical protein